jgi:hypothetical protein
MQKNVDDSNNSESDTEDLFKLGCRRIAFVAYSNSASTVAARIAGYREALFVSGAPIEPVLVQSLSGRVGGSNRRSRKVRLGKAELGRGRYFLRRLFVLVVSQYAPEALRKWK